MLFLFFLFSAFVNSVKAEEASFIDKFLASPLLILTAIVVVDVIAFAYRKIRK